MAAHGRWRAVPRLVALGAALIAFVVTSGPSLPHLTRADVVRSAAPSQLKEVRSGGAASKPPQPARHPASHALDMANLSAAGGADGRDAEPPQAPAKVAAVQHPPPPPEVQAPAPPAEQLRSRVAAFRERLAANRSAIEQAWGERLKGLRPRGIVVAAGSPNLLTNAFVGLFVLRHSLGCTLPIMVM